MSDDQELARVGYSYQSAQSSGEEQLRQLFFSTAASVYVLASDPGLTMLRRGDRIVFSAVITGADGNRRLRLPVRAILKVERWEPVWTLIDAERRRVWNRNER